MTELASPSLSELLRRMRAEIRGTPPDMVLLGSLSVIETIGRNALERNGVHTAGVPDIKVETTEGGPVSITITWPAFLGEMAVIQDS